MKTYNDFLKAGEAGKAEFIDAARTEFLGSTEYLIASDAELYYRHMNPSIMRAQKYVYNMLGKAVPDVYAANHKIPSRWYFYFVAQEVGYLLGNGVTFQNEGTKEKLGKDFDTKLQELAQYAINGGCAYGFWNYDHIEETNMILSAAQYLDDETIIRKLPFLSTDEAEEVLKRAKDASMSRAEYVEPEEEENAAEGEAEADDEEVTEE